MNKARSHPLLSGSFLLISLFLYEPMAMANAATGGIGVRVTMQDGWLTVVSVLADTPASRAGFQGGDRIATINGQSVRHVDLGDALRLLIGPPGEKVTLTVVRVVEENAVESQVTLTREAIKAEVPSPRAARRTAGRGSVPTKKAGNVQWHGDKIVSRVLPYPDFVSLFIRLPIAHAAATGQGVKIAVVQRSEGDAVASTIQPVAPDAEIRGYALPSHRDDARQLSATITDAGCRVAVVPDPEAWPDDTLIELAKTLVSERLVVVMPSDLSEDADKIATVNTLHSMGVVTVGRLDRQSTVMQRGRTETTPFNKRIGEIETDVFSTVGLEPLVDPRTPAATAAGVAALVLERWPDLTGPKVRSKIIDSARQVWQATSIETGQWRPSFAVDPVTTRYTPTDDKAVFRFRVLDAAAALGVDTEIPWFLNMMNCHHAWEITRGQGVTVVVTDQGFHIKHPDLVDHIKATKHFGPRTLEGPHQNFHGTDMSRILLAVAPEAKIIPVLCSAPNMDALPPRIAKSFDFALEQEADVITASWSGRFNKNEGLLAAVRRASDGGVVVSWFHYPESHPGVLRSSFTYAWWNEEPRLGFADRFLTDPPGFHPVEIEAGLSGTAPQAAGIAALAKSINPALTPKHIEELVVENTDAIGDTILIPDAYRIVRAAREKRPQ